MAAALLLLAGANVPSLVQSAFTGKVVAVLDGDSLMVLDGRQQVEVRLHGVDAPEGGQAFGNVCKRTLSNLVFGKTAAVQVMDIDRYKRRVSRLTVDERDVGLEMIRAGCAWHYRQYSDDAGYAAAETEARRARRGLWQDAAPVAPWNYRRSRDPRAPAPATGDAPVGCDLPRHAPPADSRVTRPRHSHPGTARGRPHRGAQLDPLAATLGQPEVDPPVIADQCAVWTDIDDKLRRMQAESETHAAAEMFERPRAKLEGFVARLEPVPRRAGALFVVDGTLAGMDLFDSPATWRKSMRKLVHGYGLDAIEQAATPKPGPAPQPARFLSKPRDAAQERFPAIGSCDDVRLTGDGVVGGGLAADGKVVHLVAFPGPKRRGGPRDHREE
jgi:endonuclease YncB( thermonuclease family)